MKHILTILIMMLALGSYASEPSVTDSISSAEKVDTMALHVGKSWVNRILDYFNDSNKNKKHKRFDFSVIGGLIMPLIPSLDWDWWQQDYTVLIRMIVFFLLLMSRFMVMSVL